MTTEMKANLTILEILQRMANQDIETVTVKRLIELSLRTDYMVRKELNLLRIDHTVRLCKNGNKSFWWINLKNKNPKLSKHDEPMVPHVSADLSYFEQASLDSMRHNCVNLTAWPDSTLQDAEAIEQEFIDNGYTIINP